MDALTRTAIYFCLLLCACIVFIGICIWWVDLMFIAKLILSLMCIGSGGALGSIGIYFLNEEE